MVGIPVKLGLNAYDRSYSGEPIIRLLNRFVEKTGVNQIEGRSLLARPGSVIERIFGDGPIRAVWAEEGAFGNDLIVVSGNSVYRWDGTTVTAISGTVPGSTDVSMDVASLSDGRRRLFFADGTLLQYYDGGSQAEGTIEADETDPDVLYQVVKIGSTHYSWGTADKLGRATFTLSAVPSADETVRVGDKTYTWKAVPANANEVDIGASEQISLDNLVAAINAGAGEGTAYGTGTTANEQCTASRLTATTMRVQSIAKDMAANLVPVADTCANGSWDNPFTYGGGDIDKVAAGIFKKTGGNFANNDTVTVYHEYTFVNSNVNVPDAAGQHTMYKVLLGATLADSLYNLKQAINKGDGAGTLYGDWHLDNIARATDLTATSLQCEAIAAGVSGNSILTSTTATGGSWTSSALLGAQAGTAIDPYLAKGSDIGVTALQSLVDLINFDGTAGTDFSIAATTHDPLVEAELEDRVMTVTYREDGGAGTATTVTPATDTFLAWGAASLAIPAGEDSAEGELTLTPTTIEDDVVAIGGVHYSWGDVATADQAGTLANPWLAKVGNSVLQSLNNLVRVINYEGVKGTDFSNDLTGPHATVTAERSGSVVTITARSEETDGNAITLALITDTSGLLTVSGATLSGGGVHALQGIEVPGGAAARHVAVLSGFAFVGLSNSQRFYWVLPGETEIDALNFAEAEFAADNLSGLLVVGDLLWLLGRTAIEHWYLTGGSPPISPVQGRAMANGAIPGTEVKIRDTVLFVGTDGVVYSYGGNHIYGGGGAPVRVSTHAIEERIRVQLVREAEA